MQNKGIEILLIEDNPGDVRLVKEYLSSAEFFTCQISQADSLQEGLSEIKKTIPDAIILDLGLPDSQGIDTYLAILDVQPKCAVILLTGLNDIELARAALEKGAQDYLIKNEITPQLLEKSVRFGIDRYRYDKKLRKSEMQLQNIIENNQDAMIVTDNKGIIRFVNSASVSLFGKSKKELPGHDFGFQTRMNQTTEIQIVKPDDSVAVCEMKTTGIRWEGQKSFLVTIRDITEKIKHENVLKASEERYRELFEHMSGGVAVYEYEEKGSILRIKDINTAGCEIMQVEKDNLLNKPIDHLFFQIHKTGLHEIIKNVIETGVQHSHGPEIFPVKHEPVWIESSVYKLSSGELVHVFDDVTHRKEAEDEIIRERRLLSTFMDSSEDNIYFKDTKSRFTDVNQAIIKWFGKQKAEELIGKTDFDFFTEEHARQAYNDEQEIIRTGQPMSNKVEKETWANNENTWVSSTKIPLFDVNNRIIGIMGISRDISDQKRTENEVKVYKEHLEDLVKIRTGELEKAKERLTKALAKEKDLNKFRSKIVSTVSHDFRTPLSVVQSSLELLQMYMSMNQGQETKAKKHINQINSAVVQMTSLLDDMLEISRVESGKRKCNPVLTDVQELCNKIVSTFNDTHESTHIQYDFRGTNNLIKIDEKLIHQIINNLLSNAIKYSPESGKVEFETIVEDAYVSFIVKDYGIGIPEKDRENLFTMFHRAENVGNIQGTGLGLSIVKSFTELHGGNVEFFSEVNKGTTFIVQIPHKTPKPEISPEEEPEIHYDWSEKSIVMVDDNKVSLLYLHELLENTGIAINMFHSGIEAIEFLKENPNTDIVLMDLEMPDIDGLTTTAKIREFNEKIPIIAQTAYVLSHSRKKSLASGFSDYIEKPIDGNQLLTVIAKFLNR